MSIIQIEHQVERKGTHILLAMYGESGSGKTLSALLFGRGLAGDNGKLCLLDTENGRGRHYAKSVPGGYAYAELTAPFTGERYIEAIQAIEKAGYDVLVIDSASHEWEGYGGVLEQADAGVDSYGKPLNGLIKWAKPKAHHKAFVQALLQTRMHIVFCLRAKEKMAQIDASDPRHSGKTRGKEVISEGFVSIQDKRFIYEMTAQLFMQTRQTERGPVGGYYVAEKCPAELHDAFRPGEQIGVVSGAVVLAWIAGDTKTDPLVDALVREGAEAASRGTDVLRAFWSRADVKPKQKVLQDHMPNWKSIAATADLPSIDESLSATVLPSEDDLPTNDMADPTNPFRSAATGNAFPGDLPSKTSGSSVVEGAAA